MPLSIDVCALPLDAFLPEPTLFIDSNGCCVVAQYPQIDPVEPQHVKPITKDGSGDARADAFAAGTRIKDADRKPGTAIVQVEMIQTGIANEQSINLDHPPEGPVCEALKPAGSISDGQRISSVIVANQPFVLRVPSNRKTRQPICGNRWPK